MFFRLFLLPLLLILFVDPLSSFDILQGYEREAMLMINVTVIDDTPSPIPFLSMWLRHLKTGYLSPLRTRMAQSVNLFF
jgi:hypothetical protein